MDNHSKGDVVAAPPEEEAVWISLRDCTSRVNKQQTTSFPRLPDKASEFLNKYLLTSVTDDMRHNGSIMVASKRVLLVFGREGSGKTTLLLLQHRHIAQQLLQRGIAKRVFVRDFRLQHWNADEFVPWVKSCLDDVDRMVSAFHKGASDAPHALHIFVAGLHRFVQMRGNDAAFNALLHLVARVRMFPAMAGAGDEVKLVLLCDESPGQFPRDLLDNVDVMHLLRPPEAEVRLHMVCQWMQAFKLGHEYAVHRNTKLALLQWDVDMDPEAIAADPNHIVNRLVVCSAGCTPREIATFMRRTFEGCSSPSESGDTVYGPAYIESLLYSVEGGLKLITPHNPATLNESTFKYAGLTQGAILPPSAVSSTCFCSSAATTIGDQLIGAKKGFVRAVPSSQQQPQSSPQNQPLAPAQLQPASVNDALASRVAEQEEKLQSAAKRSKRSRRGQGEGDDGDEDDNNKDQYELAEFGKQ